MTNKFKRFQVKSAAFIVVIAIAGTLALVLSHATTPTASIETESGTLTGGGASVISDSTASGGQAVKFAAASGGGTGNCTVSATLVNSCRPWLAAAAGGYNEVASNVEAQFLYHEKRIGRQLDVIHTYHSAGSNALSQYDKYFAERANTILETNWKPSNTWADASGCPSTACQSVNNGIDSMAASIKSEAPHKIILTVFHEPENDVSPGGSPGCGSSVDYKGSAGTTADFVAMWHNVRARFDAAGVTNVVWAVNYMGASKWNCMIKDLWPGNSYVDWVLWDPYVSANSVTFNGTVGNLYNFFSNNSDSTHSFTGKPWGLNEWGAFTGVDQAHAYTAYDNAKTALDAGTFPRLKLYTIFDTINTQTGENFEVDYTPNGVRDDTEQAHYNGFADDPRFTDAYYK